MTTDMEIRTSEEIVSSIIGTLKKQHRYDGALDPQILALAGAVRSLKLANRDIDALEKTTITEISRYGEKTVAHPAFKVQRDAMDQLTKQMRVLGLTLEDLGAAVESDPLVELTQGVMDAAAGRARIKPKR